MQWQDFDLDGKVKIPIGFYLVLAYLLRGYLIWIVSLSFRQDTGLLLSMIYPDMRVFSFTLLIGMPALLCFVLFSLKSQSQKSWFKWYWLKQKGLLFATLIMDLAIQSWSIVHQPIQSHWSQIPMVLGGFYLCWYWGKSQKISRFFQNWVQDYSATRRSSNT